MTNKATTNSSSDVILISAIALWSVSGAFLAMSSLFGARWWVTILIILGSLVLALGVLESEPEAWPVIVGGIGLFSLFGFVSNVGWIVALAITVALSGLTYMVMAEESTGGPGSDDSNADAGRSDGSGLETTSDETLLRYAREHLAEGGTRGTDAVVTALRARLTKERLRLKSDQDLSVIARRALASSQAAAAASGPTRDSVDRRPDERPRTDRRPPAEARRPEPRTSKPQRSTRTRLYEFGSFEIERVIARLLAADPGADDETLIERTLAELGLEDRSAFALERLSDAIVRARGSAGVSGVEQQAARRTDRQVERLVRAADGRSWLYEYGSPEIERVVEELLSVETKWTRAELVEGVLRVLGIEDRSPLARQRIADAADKVSASPNNGRIHGGQRRQARAGTASKRAAGHKAAQKTTARKKTTAAKKKTVAKKKTTAKKKATVEKRTPTKKTAEKKAAASAPPRTQTEPTAPRPTPQKKPSSRGPDSGAPDVKDIADLLGF